MTFELVNCENTLLCEIAMKEIRQRDLALTYRLALKSSEWQTMNWRRVNEAIIARWSRSGLERIKRMAWSGKYR